MLTEARILISFLYFFGLNRERNLSICSYVGVAPNACVCACCCCRCCETLVSRKLNTQSQTEEIEKHAITMIKKRLSIEHEITDFRKAEML